MTTLLAERPAQAAASATPAPTAARPGLERRQQWLRAVNDDVRRVLRAGAGDRIPFFCECAAPGCSLPLWLTLAEYDALSAGSAFGIAQAHEPAAAPVAAGR